MGELNIAPLNAKAGTVARPNMQTNYKKAGRQVTDSLCCQTQRVPLADGTGA